MQNETSPVSVTFANNKTAVAISNGNTHTCAILHEGSLACWGNNNFGQVGDGSSSTIRTSPVEIDLGEGVSALASSLGQNHTCAILNDHSLRCWGLNSLGQLGVGTSSNEDCGGIACMKSPTAVNLGTNRTAVAVTAGLHHTCALLDDGSVKCWGFNYFGQLG